MDTDRLNKLTNAIMEIGYEADPKRAASVARQILAAAESQKEDTKLMAKQLITRLTGDRPP